MLQWHCEASTKSQAWHRISGLGRSVIVVFRVNLKCIVWFSLNVSFLLLSLLLNVYCGCSISYFSKAIIHFFKWFNRMIVYYVLYRLLQSRKELRPVVVYATKIYEREEDYYTVKIFFQLYKLYDLLIWNCMSTCICDCDYTQCIISSIEIRVSCSLFIHIKLESNILIL